MMITTQTVVPNTHWIIFTVNFHNTVTLTKQNAFTMKKSLMPRLLSTK